MTYEGARSVIGPFCFDIGASAALWAFIALSAEMLAAALPPVFRPLADRHARLLDHAPSSGIHPDAGGRAPAGLRRKLATGACW